MVFGNLVENRICYKGDGGAAGGGGGADSPAPVTNPGSRERGRGAEPAAATGRNFRQATRDDRDPARDALVNIVTSTVANPMGDSTRADPGNIIPARTTQRDEDEIQRFVESMPTGSSTAAPIAAKPPERATNNQAELVRQLAGGGQTQPVSAVMGPAGRQDPRSGFFADAYDALYGTPDPNDDPVTAPGTALGTILGAGPVMSLFRGNTPDPADAAAFNVGQLQRMAEATGTGTVNPETGAVTGVQAGRGTLSMNPFGGVVYSGVSDPTYTGAFQELVRGSVDTSSDNEDNLLSGNAMTQQAQAPMDAGTTTPEQIDDLAVNYLQNPFFLYSGQGNLFQPYGYAGNTLVDLLQTRNMQMPGQAAPNLGLFGNPRDFS